MHFSSLFRLSTVTRKMSITFLLGMLVLPIILSACAPRHRTHAPSSPTDRLPASTAPAVEQQLLATVKNAESLGEGNPLLLSSLFSLATFYRDRQEYDKAAHQYQRALHIKEETFGPNHPDVAAILQRYALLLQEAKRSSEAANLLARADAILAQSSSTPLNQ